MTTWRRSRPPAWIMSHQARSRIRRRTWMWLWLSRFSRGVKLNRPHPEEPKARLEGWAALVLRDAQLRCAPQDEGGNLPARLDLIDRIEDRTPHRRLCIGALFFAA